VEKLSEKAKEQHTKELCCPSSLIFSFLQVLSRAKLGVQGAQTRTGKISYCAVETTLKASPLNNRSVRRTCGSKNIVERTLKECPNKQMGDPSRVDAFPSPLRGYYAPPVIER
jgi:hypothetical protein